MIVYVNMKLCVDTSLYISKLEGKDRKRSVSGTCVYTSV